MDRRPNSFRLPLFRRQGLKIFTAVVGCLLGTGCVERLLLVRSDPPGAEVVINGEVVTVSDDNERRFARTPVEVPFDFYGTFRIAVAKKNFVSESRLVPVEPPYYQYPIIDFFAEYFVPWTVTDTHEVNFELEAVEDLSDDEQEQLLERMRRLEEKLED